MTSQAFPQGHTPQICSDNHKLIKPYLPINQENLTYFNLSTNKKVQDQLQNLHSEWFPIQYSNEFFQKLLEYPNVDCLICSYNDIVVGSVIYRQKLQERFEQSQDWWPLKKVYIMTLGVIDELRGHQIGMKLMKMVEEATLNQVDKIELHVVEYNNGARRFYQKLGFQEVETIIDHYEIFEKEYSGVLMIKNVKKNRPWWRFFI